MKKNGGKKLWIEVYRCNCATCDGEFTTVKRPSDSPTALFCPYCAAEVTTYEMDKYTPSTDWNIFKRFYKR